MKPSRSPDSPSAAAALGGAAVAAAAAGRVLADQPKREVPKELAELLKKIPTPEMDAAEDLMAELARGGPATVRKLVELVGDEFGDPQGVEPKYALHGLVHYACRPGADGQRKMVAETLAAELSADHSDELKAFVCRQLQLCGSDREVPALARLLPSDRLCEPATQALLAIGGPKAAAALRDALPKAEGKRLPTVIKGLGRLREKSAAAAIRPSADSAEPDVRLVSWWALANMGDGGSADLLFAAAEKSEGYEQTQATEACLLLGRRLGESGDAAGAEKLFRRLLAARQAGEDVHDRCAALAGLAGAIGAKAASDVVEALGSHDVRYRHPAARTAVDLAGAIMKDQPAEAERLLKRVLESTEEQSVRQAAQLALEGRGERV
jgi:hypothetical protein